MEFPHLRCVCDALKIPHAEMCIFQILKCISLQLEIKHSFSLQVVRCLISTGSVCTDILLEVIMANGRISFGKYTDG
jgi:hypothetical protein